MFTLPQRHHLLWGGYNADKSFLRLKLSYSYYRDNGKGSARTRTPRPGEWYAERQRRAAVLSFKRIFQILMLCYLLVGCLYRNRSPRAAAGIWTGEQTGRAKRTDGVVFGSYI